MTLDLIEVGWADEIVEVTVTRRPEVCGDVYRVAFNNIVQTYMGKVCSPHEQQDKEAMEAFTKLLNDEQSARKAFHISE